MRAATATLFLCAAALWAGAVFIATSEDLGLNIGFLIVIVGAAATITAVAFRRRGPRGNDPRA